MTKLKKIILINMLLGMTSVANAANDKLPNGKPFVILNNQVIEVENSIQALEEKYDEIIADIYSSISELDGKVAAINLKINELEETDTQLKEKIAQIVSDLESQGTDISTLIEQYQTLNAQLEALKASAVTKSELDALVAEIETVRGSIAGVDEQVASLLSDITDNAALIELLQREMENLKVVMENAIPQGECPQGQFLRAINDDGSIVCVSSNAGTSPQITTKISSEFTIDKNALRFETLECESGQEPISGGFRIVASAASSYDDVHAVESFPWGESWQVTVKANNSWKGGSFFIHVTCLEN
ncbi:hypothetical protein [Vibrio sp. YIC-376]|uniref:hypothetical protein n=1 Tax=Vibrio sp. YIC-376 TaxID=3136162 RepID=UPI00402B0183